jgi:hypothetical protein
MLDELISYYQLSYRISFAKSLTSRLLEFYLLRQ